MKKRKKIKRYSLQERISYHHSCDVAPNRHGIKYGSPRHMYSFGFSDEVAGIDNYERAKFEFGKKAGASYRAGHRQARKLLIQQAKKK